MHTHSQSRSGVLLAAMLAALVACLAAVLSGVLSAPEGIAFANVFAVPSVVLRKVARRFVNDCVFGGLVMNEYSDEFAQRGAKKGAKATLRLPQEYLVTSGAVMNDIQELTDLTVDIEVTDQDHVAFQYDSWSATLYVDDWMERYGAPAVDQLINHSDVMGLERMTRKVAKFTGTPGTVPTTNDPYTLAKTKLREASIPTPYRVVLTTDASTQLASLNQVLFNPAPQISAFFREGQIAGKAMGIASWHEDENCDTHTVGALGGTPVVDGANQTGTQVVLSGASASIVRYFGAGDSIGFADCFEVNARSKKSTGRVKDWCIAQDVDSTAGGAVTVTLTESIRPSATDARRNCTNSPGNGAAVTTFGHASNFAGESARMGLMFHKEFCARLMVDLEQPRGVWISERLRNKKLGVSIRMVKDYQIGTDNSPARFDTAQGWSEVRGVMAAKICM